MKKGWWLLWLTAINASAVGADEAMSSATAEYATAAAEVAEAAKRRPFDRRFLAAVLNNCIDCVQNVFSKKLLSTHYNYVNLQFYTSAHE